jgi:hypothetical protein
MTDVKDVIKKYLDLEDTDTVYVVLNANLNDLEDRIKIAIDNAEDDIDLDEVVIIDPEGTEQIAANTSDIINSPSNDDSDVVSPPSSGISTSNVISNLNTIIIPENIKNQNIDLSYKNSCTSPLLVSSSVCHPSYDNKTILNIDTFVEEPTEDTEDDIVIIRTINECTIITLLPPENVRACNDVDGHIVIEWDGVPCATSYEVYRDGGVIPVSVRTSTQLYFIDEDIVDTNVHIYQVRALRYIHSTDNVSLSEDCNESAYISPITFCRVPLIEGSITGPLLYKTIGILNTTFVNNECGNISFIRKNINNGEIWYYYSNAVNISTHLSSPDTIWKSHLILNNVNYEETVNYTQTTSNTMSYATNSSRPLIAFYSGETLYFSESIVNIPAADYQWANVEVVSGIGNISNIILRTMRDNQHVAIASLINNFPYYSLSSDGGASWGTYGLQYSISDEIRELMCFFFNTINNRPYIVVYTPNKPDPYTLYRGQNIAPANYTEWDYFTISQRTFELWFQNYIDLFNFDNCIFEASCAPCYEATNIVREVNDVLYYEVKAEIC